MNSSSKWILVGSILTIVLILSVLSAGILFSLMEDRTYCPPIPSTDYSESFVSFADASLFPYNGQPSSISPNRTVQDCIDICVNYDPKTPCLGFYRENELAPIATQKTCYFYSGNNTATTLGSDVNFSAYFATPNRLTVGAQVFNTRSDVYLKKTTDRQVFRSKFDQLRYVS